MACETVIGSDPRKFGAIPAHVHLEGRPQDVRAARLFVQEQLADQLEAKIHEVEMIVSELVTNVVRRGTGPTTVGVTRFIDPPSVLITVTDTEAEFDTFADLASGRSPAQVGGGRGLQIVQAFSSEVGWKPVDPGKVVWARAALS